MKLVTWGKIQFASIGCDMPIGNLAGVSQRFIDFATETHRISGKYIGFADLRDHPEYSQHSYLTPFTGCVEFLAFSKLILVWLAPEALHEETAVHELMHAWLFFARGYRTPRRFVGEHPFHVRMFAGRIANIATDLAVNAEMKRRGFGVGRQRDDTFQFLEDFSPTLYSPKYADDPCMHWQFAEQLGFLCAGADLFEFSDKNLRVKEYVESIYRHYAPGVLAMRDLILETLAATGYEASECVGRFVDTVTPAMFEYIGERFRPEYLETVTNRRDSEGLWDPPEPIGAWRALM